LVHCSLAVPTGRSRLPSISRFAASFNHLSSPYARRLPNPSVISDLNWWQTQLSAEFCGSILSRPPPRVLSQFLGRCLILMGHWCRLRDHVGLLEAF
jgi:hypothetical protein